MSERIRIQRKKTGEGEQNNVQRSVREALASESQPLDPKTRATMEPRFGHDFSQVRVHTDERAAESAEAVSATAYTAGRDLVFGAGQYAPETSAGQRLIAHELTHVVQQSAGPVGGSIKADGLAISHPSDSFERAADHTADQVMAGNTVAGRAGAAPTAAPTQASSATVQRQAEEEQSESSAPPSEESAPAPKEDETA